MLFSLTQLVFLFNAAGIASLCLVVAICLARCFSSLPKQHGVLATGLIVALMTPLLAGVSTAFSLGILPNVRVANISDSNSMNDLRDKEQKSEQQVTDIATNANSVRIDPEVNRVMPNPDPLSERVRISGPQDSRRVESMQGVDSASSPVTTLDSSSMQSTKRYLRWILVLADVAIGVWLLGSLVAAIRLWKSHVACRRFLCTCRPVMANQVRSLFESQRQRRLAQREVPLVESDLLPAPVVVGVLKPVIVVPSGIEHDLTPRQLRYVLDHELSHIRRGDPWTGAIQSLCKILYWWNPILALIIRKMNVLREMICDDIAASADLAIEYPAAAKDYANSLLRMAERVIDAQPKAISYGIHFLSLGELESRIRRILNSKPGRVELKMNRRFVAILGLLAVLSVLGLPFVQIRSQAIGSPIGPSATAIDEGESNKTEQRGKADTPLVTIAGRVIDADGQPAPNAKVHAVSRFAKIDIATTTDERGVFEISVRMDEKSKGILRISAESSDGSLLGYCRSLQSEAPGNLAPGKLDELEIRMEAVVSALVKVIDAQGIPIPGANVACQLGYPFVTGPVPSDDRGLVSLKIPKSESIMSVLAWKDGKGLDYKLYTLPPQQIADRLTKRPEFPLDALETLTLSGASPLTVSVKDMQGTPIPGADTSIWLLGKRNEATVMNLSYFGDMLAEDTDANGQVSFEWFPDWQKEPVTVWPYVSNYVGERGVYDPVSKTGVLDIQLQRQIPIRGTVTFPDGKPAANIPVGAFGSGYSFDDFREVVMTDETGRYEIMATPNRIYLLCISGKEWSAPTQSGFAVLPGQEVVDHNFTLSPATRVFGQLLNEKTGEPISGEQVLLQTQGIPLTDMGDDILPNPEKSRRWVCPLFQQGATTGKDGEFEFFVGVGDHNLFVQGRDSEKKITIFDQAEIKIDLEIPKAEKIVLTGTVVDGETMEPVVGAILEGVPSDFMGFDEWRATTTEDGSFEIERFAASTVVHIVDPSGQRGAIIEIDADEPQVSIPLFKLGEAKGRLLTNDGTKPRSEVKLLYGVRITDKDGRLSSDRFGKIISTDANGEFTMSDLVPNWDYHCTLFDNPNGYILEIAEVSVSPGETKIIGDRKTPETPKPYVPPTLSERTIESFETSGTPLKRFQQSLRLIKEVDQNLLIVFANPRGALAKSLMKIRFEDPDFRPYYDDFLVLAIPTDNDRLPSAKELAESLNLSTVPTMETMGLVVVSPRGEVLAQWNESEESVDEPLAIKLRLFEQLEQHTTPPLEGRQLLDDALAKAKRENKRVIVEETATWCGPCRLLNRLLEKNRQWEKDYIWVKMDHRWIGGKEIMQEIRNGADGGVPWFAILDSDGQTLATSNDSKSGKNIGFPSEPESLNHLSEMLKSTRQRMTDQEIEDLVAAASSKK